MFKFVRLKQAGENVMTLITMQSGTTGTVREIDAGTEQRCKIAIGRELAKLISL